ncbi:hypothetical protein E4T49_04109 [Aureobasidium sp. EXF-10728]|nr:hypothetical protein E4T49_04109 [Aureobasidium sp. EXF-10728]
MATLQSPTIPISINSTYTTTAPRTLGLRCHDRHFRDAIVCDEHGNRLFDFTAKTLGTSWTLRRSLIDSTSQTHILDLRHTKTSYKSWILEDSTGTQVSTIKDVTRGNGFTAVDVQVAGNYGVRGIEVRSFDHAGSRTSFLADGMVVAEMTLVDNNDAALLHKRGLDRTTWKLEVAEGVDIALIVAVAFARAEISHAWRR